MKTMILLVVLFVASVGSAEAAELRSSMPSIQESHCLNDKTLQWESCAPKLINDSVLVPDPPAGSRVLACTNGANVWHVCERGEIPKTPCETQLREALEAVEPYLSWRQSSHVTAEYCNERCSINRQLEALDRREKVQAQYQAALKECGKS